LIDDTTVAEKDHPIRPRSELRVVGDDDRRDPPLAGGKDHAHHGFAVCRVERSGRLVGEEEAALTDHRASDRDPLTLTAGELIGIVLGPICEAQLYECRHPRGVRLLGGQAVELER
jgi:hypothetical protein